MPPSMSTLMASVNPCPNPHIPPIRFEFCDVLATSSVQDSQEHTIQAERALRAYWAQAANMTKIDQQEYIRLLKKGSFAVPKDAIADPSKHPLYRGLVINPSWPMYVMLKAMYDQDTFNQRLLGKLEDNLKLVFGSLDIKDFTSIYHHAGLAKRKREQESESDDDQDIPSRIVKKQPPENSSAEKITATYDSSPASSIRYAESRRSQIARNQHRRSPQKSECAAQEAMRRAGIFCGRSPAQD